MVIAGQAAERAGEELAAPLAEEPPPT